MRVSFLGHSLHAKSVEHGLKHHHIFSRSNLILAANKIIVKVHLYVGKCIDHRFSQFLEIQNPASAKEPLENDYDQKSQWPIQFYLHIQKFRTSNSYQLYIDLIYHHNNRLPHRSQPIHYLQFIVVRFWENYRLATVWFGPNIRTNPWKDDFRHKIFSIRILN